MSTQSPTEWNLKETVKWAKETFPFEDIGKSIFVNKLTGLDLLELTSSEKAMKAGLSFGHAAQVVREVKKLCFTSSLDASKVIYKSKISFEKSDVTTSLYSFEQFLVNKGVSLNGKDWRTIFVDNLADQALTDVKNKTLILRVLDQLPEDTDWKTAKNSFIAEVFPTANDDSWLSMLMMLQPMPTDTMQEYCDRFIHLHDSIFPLCATLQATPNLAVQHLHKKIPWKYYDLILSRNPKLSYESLQEYVSILKEVLANTFATKFVWKESRTFPDNNNRQTFHGKKRAYVEMNRSSTGISNSHTTPSVYSS